MGMYATYRGISLERYAELLADPEQANRFFGAQEDYHDLEQWGARVEEREASGERFSLEKEWHVLHYLLTGDASLEEPCHVPPRWGHVVLGGTTNPFQAGYGHVRCLSPGEVRCVVEAMRQVSVELLRTRFKPLLAGTVGASVYPHGEKWEEEDVEDALELYPHLVQFFNTVAEAGNMMLLSVD